MESSDPQLRILICSYNLPEETDAIYQKLLADGFAASDILVMDNGSDKYPPAQSANFRLPYNVRFTGQARIGLEYLMDFFPAKHYWVISTSAKLLPSINYKKTLENSLHELQIYKPAIISHSFQKDQEIYKFIYKTEEERKRYESQFKVQTWSEDRLKYKAGLIDGWLQLISTVFTHDLLNEARKCEVGFWNKDLYRGWGIAAELIYLANRMGRQALVLYDSHIIWVQNKTYRENRDVESITEYRRNAAAEERTAFEKRYGRNVYLLFRSWFSKAARQFRNDKNLYSDLEEKSFRQTLQARFPQAYTKVLSRFL